VTTAPERRRRRTVRTLVALAAIAVVAGAAGLLYLGHVSWLTIGATEGDVPSATAMDFPAGADLVDTDIVCGSGGCTALFTLHPADGTTPAELARDITAAHDGRIPGTFTDPRTIDYTAEPGTGTVLVAAGYWSYWG
jgi:hypothetical protein